MASERDRSRSPRSSNDEIIKLIFSREQARFAKDWALADQIRDRLNVLGVSLFDKTNQWRSTDGRTGRIPTWAEIQAGQTFESMPSPTEIKTTPDGTSGSEDHIKQLVQMREQARASKDFEQSDRLRDELKAMGVELLDKEKLWRTKTGLQGCILGYRSSGPTDMEINTLVVQRERARQSSDFATADMIRDELKAAGVDIRDKEKVWRAADGRSGPVPSWGEITGSGGAPDQVGMPILASVPMGMRSPAQVAPGTAHLQTQVIQAALVAAQNPATAGRALQLLQQAAGLALPGVAALGPPVAAQRVAKTAGTPALPGRTAPEVQEALTFISSLKIAGRAAADSEIEWLVQLREKMRQNKDFSSADELRNALRNSIGVELHEKEKQWVANDGRQGTIPMWSNLS